MQKVLSVLLAVLCLLIGCQQALMLTHFKLNQDRIEQTLCVNKNQPELQCHGTCYLNKKLKRTKNSKSVAFQIYKKIEILPTYNVQFQVKSSLAKTTQNTFKYENKLYLEPNQDILVPPPIFYLK